MRGTLDSDFPIDAHCGIIPACAGNTARRFTTRRRWRDHPRVCGEHVNELRTSAGSLGSSPRVRGTLRLRPRAPARRGIIPACAGNTILLNLFSFASRDHPRVCGEHVDVCTAFGGLVGSSPRVRGTRKLEVRKPLPLGIIPACAGNTCEHMFHKLV